ncbi:hypothetical protein SAMN04490239_1748 [Rhodococcus koreensis]|uniref:Uncharacterized protein n=1 Tax=Rhodococcus koreensis TaxID=99653 RepID=A0A1H4MCL3_9NOCA|nr:hypothetical protein SAMN04490239_1748 [Rhodococcus koreensis]
MPSRSPNGSAPAARETGPRRPLIRNPDGGGRSHDFVPRRSAVHQCTPLDAHPGGSCREAAASSTCGAGSLDAHGARPVPRQSVDAPRHRQPRPAPDDGKTHSVPVGMASARPDRRQRDPATTRPRRTPCICRSRRGRCDLPSRKKPAHNDDRRPRDGAGDHRCGRDGASPFTVPRGPFRARGGAGRPGRHRAPAAGRRGVRPAPSRP